MHVSVIVPVLDAAGTLPACLAALERLEPAPAEILIVDNGSKDASLALARSFASRQHSQRVQILQETERGASAARNTGVRASQGDVIAFTDADCAPEPDWLGYVLPFFEDPTVGAVAGRVVPAPPASVLERFSALYTLRAPEAPSRHRTWTPDSGGFPTANLVLRKNVFDAIGGFDSRLRLYGEDYDLCARIYAAGREIAYEPRARVAHRHRTSFGGMLRQAFGFGGSHAYLMREHGSRLLWVDLPGTSLRFQGFPFPVWVDLAAADKKVMALVGAGLLHPLLWGFLPPYVVYLGVSVFRHARQGAPVSAWTSTQLAALLLLKSGALSLGRWWGSIRWRALCL